MKGIYRCFAIVFLIVYIVSCFMVIPVQAQPDLKGFKKVAESKYLSLYYNESNKIVSVLDKRSGYIWSSAADSEYLKKAGVEDFFIQNFSSLWILTYTNLAGQESTTKDYSSFRSDVEAKTLQLKNGIKIDFYIPRIRIKFSILYTLQDDSLVVTIPANSIKELIGVKEELEKALKGAKNKLNELKEVFKKVKSAKITRVVTKKRINNIGTDIENIENTISTLQGVDDLNRKAASIASYAYDINAELIGSQEKGRGIIEIVETSKKYKSNVIEQLKKMSQLANELYTFGDTYRLQEIAGIVKIDLMPYFGSAGDNENGYMFIPDGCGAIAYYKKNHPQYLSFYSKEIYTETLYDLDQYTQEINNGLQEISLPVIGVKKGNNGFIAIAEKGSANSAINFMPSGYEVNLNRIYFSFIYRRLFETVTKNWNGQYYKIYETTPIVTDRQIRYIFLDGKKEVSYSTMANKFRGYLISNKLINRSTKNSSLPPLGLDVFMGIKEERILFDRFITMTTYSQIKEILNDLRRNGVCNIDLNLIGWSKGGYDVFPSSFWPERKLGGEKGFRDLLSHLKQFKIPLLLQVNLIDAYLKVGGFSLNRDVVRLKNGKQLTTYKRDRFLFTPIYVQNTYSKKLINFLKKYNLPGISLEKIGWYVYSDYRGKNVVSREKTTIYWMDLLNKFKNQGIRVATLEGNVYVLKYADRILNLPYKSSGYSYFDDDIPFYQMVIHGLIPYSMKPFNLFYDSKIEKLKAIEYGAMPYYQITYNDSSELKYTTYRTLFTSKYSNWRRDIIETYKTFNAIFKGINNRFIISHKKYDNGVVRVIYDNKTTIYINYSERPQKVDNITIKPLDVYVKR